MADPTRSEMREAALYAASVPAHIRARLSDAELAARCNEAATLSRAAETASDPVLKRSYAKIAKATIGALPAAEVRARHQQLKEQADSMTPGAARDRVLREMDQLLEDNPTPDQWPVDRPEVQARDNRPVYQAGATTGLGHPRRSPQASLPGDTQANRIVVKAAAEEAPPPPERLIVCFSQTGQIIGCCYESRLIPVLDPADVGQPAVAKASAGPKAQRPAKR